MIRRSEWLKHNEQEKSIIEGIKGRDQITENHVGCIILNFSQITMGHHWGIISSGKCRPKLYFFWILHWLLY